MTFASPFTVHLARTQVFAMVAYVKADFYVLIL